EGAYGRRVGSARAGGSGERARGPAQRLPPGPLLSLRPRKGLSRPPPLSRPRPVFLRAGHTELLGQAPGPLAQRNREPPRALHWLLPSDSGAARTGRSGVPVLRPTRATPDPLSGQAGDARRRHRTAERARGRARAAATSPPCGSP